jgi:P pilus assembly chaperone PapD
MKASRHWILVSLFACLSWSSSLAGAAGGMQLNRSIVIFEPGKPPREDVLILNQENENLYVNVTIMEVENPGTEAESRIKLTDPGLSKLIVTPNRLIVPPLGRKPIRLVNLEPSETERIYRVDITPVLPPLEDPKTSMVRIVVAYQLLVIVRPLQPREELVAEREGQQLRFDNRGNTNVLLTEGRQCDASGESCTDLPTRRIYAGNRFEVSLPYTTPASYKLTTGDTTRQAVYP